MDVSVEMAKNKDKKKNGDKKKGDRNEREDSFPSFPSEVDIMLKVVDTNVDLIKKTCKKGNGPNLFRLFLLVLDIFNKVQKWKYFYFTRRHFITKVLASFNAKIVVFVFFTTQ